MSCKSASLARVLAIVATKRLFKMLLTNRTGQFFSFFLMSYVGERPRWPIQSPNRGRQQKAKRRDDLVFDTLYPGRCRNNRYSM